MKHPDLTDVPIFEHSLESWIFLFLGLPFSFFTIELGLEIEDLGIIVARLWSISRYWKPI